MTLRDRLFAYGLCALLIAGGTLAVLTVGGSTGQVLAFVLIALGFVLAISLVFYEVGLSEDRDRARQEKQTRKARRRAMRPGFRFKRERDHARRLS